MTERRRALVRQARVAALGLALLALAGCDSKNTPRSDLPNVVLISVDTLRADVLGAYGSTRDTMPCLDELARESVVFLDAIANSNNTLLSHVSMLTGLYPTTHRVRPGETTLPTFFPTLSELLHERGYATAFVAAHASWLHPRYGFARGVDAFRSDWVWADEIDARAIEWLRGHAREPFFLFAHYYDAHSDFAAKGPLPYRAPDPFFGRFHEGYTGAFDGCDATGKRCASDHLQDLSSAGEILPAEDLRYIRALYEEEVLYTDSMVGKLLDELRRGGLLDRTLLLFTSDHGEEFQEHGKFLHGTVFEGVAKVPLLVRFPGGSPTGEVAAMAEGVDLVPTILDFLGLPIPPAVEGESLLPIVRGEPRRKPYGMVHTVALRSSRWKAIAGSGGKPLLFDLAADPGELRDVASEHPDVIDSMWKYYEDLTRSQERRYAELAAQAGGEPAPVAISPEERARLEALGYYGGSDESDR